MERILRAPSKGLAITYRIAFALLLAMILLIIGGSLYAMLRPPESGPLFRLGDPEKSGSTVFGGAARRGGNTPGGSGGSEEAVFSGIGRLRIPVAGEGVSLMIISVAFPYPANDSAFTEELASKISDLKMITTEYFSSLPAGAAANLNEETAKAELLKRYNAILRLGKIKALYFSDLVYI
jgi:flagellar basal body-associated protein FliL